MRLDHRDDGLLRSMWIEEIQRGLGGLGGNGRVHDRQAVLAFDDCHVGQVQVTHLVDPLHDLEQAGNIQKLRLPPQAGVDGIRGVGAFFDEVSLGWVPHQVALFALDHRRRQRRDGAVVGEIKKSLIRNGSSFSSAAFACLVASTAGLGACVSNPRAAGRCRSIAIFRSSVSSAFPDRGRSFKGVGADEYLATPTRIFSAKTHFVPSCIISAKKVVPS